MIQVDKGSISQMGAVKCADVTDLNMIYHSTNGLYYDGACPPPSHFKPDNTMMSGLIEGMPLRDREVTIVKSCCEGPAAYPASRDERDTVVREERALGIFVVFFVFGSSDLNHMFTLCLISAFGEVWFGGLE